MIEYCVYGSYSFDEDSVFCCYECAMLFDLNRLISCVLGDGNYE